ncbi:integrase, catalytic region, zinc finger, CCHC-type containing protein [Tanacetum coccineum]|uniref:Integrase, catalytic region, zinc finger, CCHC-type containing protein n=1 Tax=Tanacetum coccineum TaxID=301880 RepID=A0ABQ5FFH1_9ASTR
MLVIQVLEARKVICYNCRGEGHVARQCKEQKKKDGLSVQIKDKSLLMEAKRERNEVHQEEHLDSDAETEIDDNTIPYHQYLLDTEAQNVPTEVSADTSDKVSMIAILTDCKPNRPYMLKLTKKEMPSKSKTLKKLSFFSMHKGICQAVLNLFLYDADTLLHPNHHPVSIWDSEELNALMFVPQKELSGDQAYWLSANEIASQALNYKQCIVTSMPPMQIWKLTSKDNSFKGKSNDTNPGLLDAQINIMKVLKLGTTEGEYSLSRTAYTERGLVAFTAEKYQS